MKALPLSLALFAGSALLATGAPVAAQQLAASAAARRDLTDLGVAPSKTMVTVAVTLNYRDKAGLDALVLAQGTPSSPQFHKFLTPAQFAARFGPTAADHNRVVASLRRAGFTILRTYANNTVIDATAPAAVAGAYFRTQFHQFTQAGHGTRYANVTSATIPDDIAASVSSILGLDNVVKMRPQNKPALYYVDASKQPSKTTGAAPIERVVSGKFAGIYPAGLSIAYKFPAQSGFTGAGHAIAIVIDSDITNANLSTFWTAAGVTRTGAFTRVLVNGTNPGVNADVGETAIDTETTSSLAPAANIDLYLISSLSDADIEDAYNLVVSNNNVDVASSSFGGCELDDTPFASATDAIAEQGAALGISFTASTGDAGGDCEDETARGRIFYSPDIVSSPASGPHFLAIGGTTLTINATTGARVDRDGLGPGRRLWRRRRRGLELLGPAQLPGRRDGDRGGADHHGQVAGHSAQERLRGPQRARHLPRRLQRDRVLHRRLRHVGRRLDRLRRDVRRQPGLRRPADRAEPEDRLEGGLRQSRPLCDVHQQRRHASRDLRRRFLRCHLGQHRRWLVGQGRLRPGHRDRLHPRRSLLAFRKAPPPEEGRSSGGTPCRSA